MRKTAPPLRGRRSAKTAQVERAPGDVAIRAALRTRLLDQFSRDSDTVLIEELGLRCGSTKVDIAVVNGLLSGFEIKSDRDTVRRLGPQVHLYSKVLDHATLVIGDRLLAAASDLVPKWWGVLHVRPTPCGLKFRTIRRARRNPQRDPRVLVELLWADQAMALLEERNVARGVRGKPRRVLWDRICDHFEVDEIAAAVRSTLKARSVRQAPA